MPTRSYEEAVELVVNWWIEKSFKTPLNQNNGDNSDAGSIAFLLMNINAGYSQREVTIEQIEKFKSRLTELLLQSKERGDMIKH
jgi:hypothetical protein